VFERKISNWVLAEHYTNQAAATFLQRRHSSGGGGNMVVKMHAAELGMTFTPLPHAIPLILLLEQQKDNSYDMEKE
jgi:hypothetical protein